MRWGFVDGEPSVAFVESADPADLQARIDALLTVIGGLEAQAVTAVELAGAGDGHAFTVRVEYGALGSVLDFSPAGPLVDDGTPGGFASPLPPLITPVVYMASDAVELAAARTRYYADNAFPAQSMVIGSEMAGATQSRRVCVLELIGPTSLYTPPAEPVIPP